MKYALLTIFTILLSQTAFTQVQNRKTDSVFYNDLNAVTVLAVQDISYRKTSINNKLVYSSKDFERFELSTIGDYLRSLPGVVMDKGNESKDVKFRGLDKEYTQILINGERIPDGGEKREFQVDRIPLNMVERIEINRSPVASLDAQGAAGTINIILKKSVDRKTLRFNASVGKVEDHGNTFDGYLQYGSKLGKNLNFLLNGGYQTRIAPKIKLKESYKNNILQSSDIENEVKKYKEANFAPRIDWNPSSKHSVSFDPLYLYSQENKLLDKPAYKFTTNAGTVKTDTTYEKDNEIKDRAGWSLRGIYTFKPSDKHMFSIRPVLQQYTETKDKLTGKYKADGISVTENNTETETKHDKEILNRFTYQYTGVIQQISAGIEFSFKDRDRDKIKSKNGVAEKAGAKDRYTSSEDRINVYLMDDIRLGEQHTISPGIRTEITSVQSGSRYFNSTNRDTVVKRAYNYATFNPTFNYLWNVSKNINLRFNAARTVRRPQFDQLSPFLELKGGTLANPDNIGNPNLVPEIATGGDWGVDFFIGKNNKQGVIGFNTFYRFMQGVIENNIYLANNNRYVTQLVNGGDGKVWGFELDARFTIQIPTIGQFIPRFNGSILRSEILDAKTKQLRKFKGQPDYVYNIGAEYVSKNKRFSIGANFNKVPINNEAETKTDGSYEIKQNTDIQRLDVFLNYNITQKIALRFSGQNLLTKSKEVRKTVYTSANVLSSYDIERENYSSAALVSIQWNIR